jgi:hypothetical protein
MKITKIRSWLLNEREVVGAVTTTFADNISSLAGVAGMLFLPLIPAGLTGLSLLFMETTWPLWAVVAVAVIVAVGLESLGIAASKTAMRLYRAWRDDLSLISELIAVVIITGLYATLVFLVIWLSGALPDELRWIGYVSPFLAVGMYVVVGFNADLQQRRDELLQARALELDFELKIKTAEIEDATERLAIERKQDMAIFEQKQQIKLERAQARLDQPRLTPEESRRRAREIIAENPYITGAELARQLGVTRHTGSRILKEVNGQ